MILSTFSISSHGFAFGSIQKASNQWRDLSSLRYSWSFPYLVGTLVALPKKPLLLRRASRNEDETWEFSKLSPPRRPLSLGFVLSSLRIPLCLPTEPPIARGWIFSRRLLTWLYRLMIGVFQISRCDLIATHKHY